jgi:hypothetical protein
VSDPEQIAISPDGARLLCRARTPGNC